MQLSKLTDVLYMNPIGNPIYSSEFGLNGSLNVNEKLRDVVLPTINELLAAVIDVRLPADIDGVARIPEFI